MSGVIQNPAGEAQVRPTGLAATLSKNVAVSLARVMVNSVVALVLPAYLTHHLPVSTYSAWVLILQLAAYVSFLDFGVQVAIAKFVAEFEARGDQVTAGQYASAGLAIMLVAAVLGCCLSGALAWQVPRLFHSMPASLYRDVRVSVLLVGFSFSLGLVCSVFSAVFLGLQRYSVPMVIAILNKLLFTAAVLIAVLLHGSLAAMGAAAAAINGGTGLLQVVAWRNLASNIRVSIGLLSLNVLKRVTRYCSTLSIWTFGMLCVSGLDVVIVGHYDFSQTGFYSIATLPTNFTIMIVSSMLSPMVPASSALSTHRSPSEMGDILARTTRYCTIFLLLLGLPLMVCGLPILRLWVGPAYALETFPYLRILVLANVIRNLCAPYATMVAAMGKQATATAAAMCEAIVNLGSSLYLAQRFGAIGVAYGTVLGSLVSVSIHFAVTMHFTHEVLSISRTRLLLKGLLRPAIAIVPSILILPVWWSTTGVDRNPPIVIIWIASTLLLVWLGGLTQQERKNLMRFTTNRLMVRFGSG